MVSWAHGHNKSCLGPAPDCILYSILSYLFLFSACIMSCLHPVLHFSCVVFVMFCLFQSTSILSCRVFVISYPTCILFHLYPVPPVSCSTCILSHLYPIPPVSCSTCMPPALYPLLLVPSYLYPVPSSLIPIPPESYPSLYPSSLYPNA